MSMSYTSSVSRESPLQPRKPVKKSPSFDTVASTTPSVPKPASRPLPSRTKRRQPMVPRRQDSQPYLGDSAPITTPPPPPPGPPPPLEDSYPSLATVPLSPPVGPMSVKLPPLRPPLSPSAFHTPPTKGAEVSGKAKISKAYTSRPLPHKPTVAQPRSHSQSLVTTETQQYDNIDTSRR